MLLFKRILLFLMLPLGFAASAQTTLGTITTGSSGCKFTTTVCVGDTVHFTPQNASSYTNYHWYSSSVDAGNEITAATAASFNVVATNFASNFPTLSIVTTGGTYILTAEYTTPTGCTAINDTLIINYNPLPAANTASSALCETTSGGGTAVFTLTSLDATVNGGVSSVTVTYHATLADAQSGSNTLSSPYTSASATIYARVLNITTGCYNTTPVTLKVNPKPSLTITDPAAVCSSATVDLTASVVTAGSTLQGGTLSYWTDAASTSALSTPNAVTTSGKYYIKVTTAPGCTDIQPVNVVVNPKPSLVITDPTAVCSPTTVDITASAVTSGSTLQGGTLSYWTDAAATSALSTPNAVTTIGKYYIKVTTAAGCTDIQPVNVTVYPTINPPTGSNEIICSGTTIAPLTATVSGANISVNWYDAATGGNLKQGNSLTYTPATAGDCYAEAYNTVTGCKSATRTKISLIVNPNPTISVNAGSPTCHADLTQYDVAFTTSSGTTITSSAGTVSGSSIINIPIATASITITATDNVTNCATTITVNAPNCSCPTINPPTGTNEVICSGVTIAPLTATVSGANISVNWYDAATGGTLKQANSTTYTPSAGGDCYAEAYNTVTGCKSATRTKISLIVNPNPTISVTAGSPTCHADLTQYDVAFTASSGTTITSSAGTVSGSSIINIPIATASITITATDNATNCATTITVNAPNCSCPTINPPTGTNEVICSGVTIAPLTATVSGANISVNWYDAATGGNLKQGNSLTYTPATAGDCYAEAYNTVTGCKSATRTKISLIVNPNPVLTITNPVTVCSPNTVDITAASVTSGSNLNGGTLSYFYDAAGTNSLTSGNAITASNTYYIKATTAAGCTDIKPVIVSINPLPTLMVNNTTCHADLTQYDVSFMATGGTVTADNGTVSGNSIINVPTNANVVITVTSASGCKTTQTVTPPNCNCPTINAPISQGDEIICEGSTIAALTVMVNGTNISANWYDAATGGNLVQANSTSFLPTVSGTYYAEAYNSITNCKSATRTPVKLVINPTPSLTVTNPQAVCAPTMVDLTAASVTTGSTLYGASLTYFVDAGTTTVLNNANTIVSTGTFFIKATTLSGCTDIKPVTATINPTPVLKINNPTTVCSPFTVDLTVATVTNGSTLQGGTLSYWLDASATQILTSPNAVSSTGTYYIKATTSNGCSDIKPVNITVNPTPSLAVTNPSAVCSPNAVDITAANVTTGSNLQGGSLTYWTNPATSIALNNPNAISIGGTYYIKATSPAGCTDVKPVVITVNPTPTLVVTDPPAVCAPNTIDLTKATITTGSNLQGGSLSYFTDAGGTIVMSNPSAVTISGTYYIKVTTAGGCSDIKPVNLFVNPKPSLTITNPSPVCSPNTVDLTVANVTAGSNLQSGMLTYFSDAAATQPVSTPSAVSVSGTYYVQVTTIAGCTDIQPVIATINTSPTLTITGGACHLDLMQYDVTFTVTGGTVTSSAGTVSGNSIINIPAGTNITITATSTANCIVVKSVTAPNCSCTPVNPAVSSGDQTVCSGTAVLPTLNVTVVGTNVSANWYDSATGGTLLQSNSTAFTPTSGGTYYAEAYNTVTNCVAISRTAVTLTVNQTPDVSNIVTRVDTASCTGPTFNSDARVCIRKIINGKKYAYSTNGTVGLFYATATPMTTDSAVINNLASPNTATVYTIRIYGADSTCYKDVTATLNPTHCPCQITATWAQNPCNGNGTQAITGDDYFTVNVTATGVNGGTSGKYEVVVNNTVLNTGGTSYGQQVTVGGAGVFNSDGITIYTLTVRDFDAKLCVSQSFTTAPSASCSTLGCPPNVICVPVQTLRQKK